MSEITLWFIENPWHGDGPIPVAVTATKTAKLYKFKSCAATGYRSQLPIGECCEDRSEAIDRYLNALRDDAQRIQRTLDAVNAKGLAAAIMARTWERKP